MDSEEVIITFNGNEGMPMDPTQAAAWTANYRLTIGPGETKAVFFGKNILNAILDQRGCMGIRMYFAINNEGKRTLVLVGANAAGYDQLDGIVADFGSTCPNTCDTTSNLCT